MTTIETALVMAISWILVLVVAVTFGAYRHAKLGQRVRALDARVTAAETKLRAVQWLAERRFDPAAVRADSIRRECAAAAARNGGADCGL